MGNAKPLTRRSPIGTALEVEPVCTALRPFRRPAAALIELDDEKEKPMVGRVQLPC
jgi:hypothetical protein